VWRNILCSVKCVVTSTHIRYSQWYIDFDQSVTGQFARLLAWFTGLAWSFAFEFRSQCLGFDWHLVACKQYWKKVILGQGNFACIHSNKTGFLLDYRTFLPKRNAILWQDNLKPIIDRVWLKYRMDKLVCISGSNSKSALGVHYIINHNPFCPY